MKYFSLLLPLLSGTLSAQYSLYNFSPTFQIMTPASNTLASEYYEGKVFPSLGMDFNMSLDDGHSPLKVGMQYSMTQIYSQYRREDFEDDEGEAIYCLSSGAGSLLHSINGYLRVDLLKDKGYPLMPYFSAIAGYQHLDVSNVYDQEIFNPDEDDVYEIERIGSDSFVYGFNVGINYRVTRGLSLFAAWQRMFSLNNSTFIDPSTVQIDHAFNTTFDTFESRSDMNTFTIGFTFIHTRTDRHNAMKKSR